MRMQRRRPMRSFMHSNACTPSWCPTIRGNLKVALPVPPLTPIPVHRNELIHEKRAPLTAAAMAPDIN